MGFTGKDGTDACVCGNENSISKLTNDSTPLLFSDFKGKRRMFNWAACTISLLVSNLSCFALCSYFFSILPTKRNLLTYLNNLLVITMTLLVNFMVSKEWLFKGHSFTFIDSWVTSIDRPRPSKYPKFYLALPDLSVSGNLRSHWHYPALLNNEGETFL